MTTPRTSRPGLTLLEVIVAITIFFLSIIAISQLMQLGIERAEDVRYRTQTSIRCQAKMAEVMIGAQPLSTTDYTPYTDAETVTGADKLSWKVECDPYPGDSAAMLWTVKVWVKADLAGGRSIESHLCQTVLDPSQRGTTFDQPNPVPAGTATQDTDSSTTPSTTPSGGSNTPMGGGAAMGSSGGKMPAGGGNKAGSGTGAGIGGGNKTGAGGGTGAGKAGAAGKAAVPAGGATAPATGGTVPAAGAANPAAPVAPATPARTGGATKGG
jgi:Tfp pilus assembly protein PilV